MSLNAAFRSFLENMANAFKPLIDCINRSQCRNVLIDFYLEINFLFMTENVLVNVIKVLAFVDDRVKTKS